MKTYEYVDQLGRHVMTEREILADMFSWWSARMLALGKAYLISEENCIGDWIVIHWAREVDATGKTDDESR